TVELERDDYLPRLVDVVPLPAGLHRSQTFTERPSTVELQRDDHISRFVDVAPLTHVCPAALYHCRHRCQPFAIRPGKVILWRCDHLSGLVNVAIFLFPLKLKQWARFLGIRL